MLRAVFSHWWVAVNDASCELIGLLGQIQPLPLLLM
jgi:hypothetical protein